AVFASSVLGLGVWSVFSWRLTPARRTWCSAMLVRAGCLVTRHRWFVAGTALSSVCFAWLVTGGSFNFNYSEVFGVFYDYQGASLLRGHLDVPEEAIGPEAFAVGGKLYGYFGPTPSLLRMPFLVAGVAFGKLSRAFMVAYFVACLIASYLLLLHAL